MLPLEYEDYIFFKNKTNIVTIIEKKTPYVKGKPVIFLGKLKIMSNHVISVRIYEKKRNSIAALFCLF
jgi:hypothetical protein